MPLAHQPQIEVRVTQVEHPQIDFWNAVVCGREDLAGRYDYMAYYRGKETVDLFFGQLRHLLYPDNRSLYLRYDKTSRRLLRLLQSHGRQQA